MKKLLYLLLALMMCLSLAACGGGDKSDSSSDANSGGDSGTVNNEESDSDSEDENVDDGNVEDNDAEDASGASGAGGNYYTNYSVFEDIQVFAASSVEDLVGTTWDFAGGMSGGQDMEEEDANMLLEAYGGTFQIEFTGTDTANLLQGSGALPGTFGVLDDGVTLNFSFEYEGTSYDYVAAFTVVGEDNVLVLVNTTDGETAFYFYML